MKKILLSIGFISIFFLIASIIISLGVIKSNNLLVNSNPLTVKTNENEINTSEFMEDDQIVDVPDYSQHYATFDYDGSKTATIYETKVYYTG